jgi:nicotinamidase-related amidase
MLEKLDIASTALVLIDVQEGILSFPFSPHSGQAVRSAGAELAKAFRAAGGLVVLTRVVYASDFADALQQPVDNPLPGGPLPSNWSVFSPELAVSAKDVILDKRNWGAFYGTDLELQLVRRGIKTIVIGGVATNMGVESTARDAHERNYHLIFADGAISSMSEDMHKFAMGTIFPLIGRIKSVGDVLGALK